MDLLYSLPDELLLKIFNLCKKVDLCNLSKAGRQLRSTVNRLWCDTKNLASPVAGYSWATVEVISDLVGFRIIDQRWLMKCVKHQVQQWASIANNAKIIFHLENSAEESCSMALSHPEIRQSMISCKVVLVDGRGFYPDGLYENKTIVDARILECTLVGDALRTPWLHSGITDLENFRVRALRLTFEDFSTQYLTFRFSSATFPRNYIPEAHTLNFQIFPRLNLKQLIDSDVCSCWAGVPDFRRILSVPFRYWQEIQINISTVTYLQGIVDYFGFFSEGTIDREGPLFSEMALLRAASAYDIGLNLSEEDSVQILNCKLGEIVGPVNRPLTMVLSSDDMALIQGRISKEDLSNFETLVRSYRESSGFPFHSVARESAELQNLFSSLCNVELADDWSMVAIINEKITLEMSNILDANWAKIVGCASLESYYLFPESGMFGRSAAVLVNAANLYDFQQNLRDLIFEFRKMRITVLAASLRLTHPSLNCLNRIAEHCNQDNFDVVVELRQIMDRPTRVYLRQMQKENVNLEMFTNLLTLFTQ